MGNWIYLFVLLCLALLLMIYPLRRYNKALILIISLFFIGLSGVAYWQWGGFYQLKRYEDKQRQTTRANEVLKQYKTPAALIDKLTERLRANPNSAKGWYLLGRLLASQNQWPAARDAFSRAVALDSLDLRYRINWIDALWNVNQQQFNPMIRKQLHQVLNQDPKQPDALAMLAMDAYQQQRYRRAIVYWEMLLQMTSPDSDAARALRKAIAKAQQQLHL